MGKARQGWVKSLGLNRLNNLGGVWALGVISSCLAPGPGMMKAGLCTQVSAYHVACLLLSLTSVQFSSVAQSCLTLCDLMNHSMAGLRVHHQLPEYSQTHVHQVGDAIQPSHPLCTLLILPSIFPSIRVFSNESTLRMRWPNIGVSASA